ncbi:Phosphoribosyltransferase [Gigaspora margarita]|uniref:Phosphoribosyltransferase n=1 Tax=Gigaspora margarita TaxID=4874 RepID=A0A8H4A894_GIGMA|nr:Phosphoribosyltransferase [Gigaspora margarita]
MIEKLQNRVQAGKLLADEIAKKYNNDNNDVIILALPRGGVPVAYQISQHIKAPLDVFLVRKIGVEGHEELAMGAITETSTIYNEDIIAMLHINQESINRVIKRESAELQRRNEKYRKGKPAPDVTGKTTILVDDGIATGATMRAAYTSLRKLNPKKIVIAVPVAAPDTLTKMSKEVDDIICLLVPKNLGGIGAWYQDFTQTEDKEVLELLERADRDFPVPTMSVKETAKLQNEAIVE